MASPTSSTNPMHPAETNNGVVTLWLPVTSAWPSVSVCSGAIYTQNGGKKRSGPSAIGFDPFFGQNVNTDLNCLPPFATSWWQQRQQTPAQTVTSLGPLVCPGLYTTATTSILNPSSTFVGCCPSDYDFQSTTAAEPGNLGQCNSALTVGQTLSYATLEDSWVMTTTIISAEGASVFGVPVNGYIFATTTPPPTSSSTSTSIIQTSIDALSESLLTGSPATGSSKVLPLALQTASAFPITAIHLSSGAKAGIGVGVTLAVTGLCCLAVALFFLRRRKQHIAEEGGQEGELALASSSKGTYWDDGDAQGFDPAPKQTFEMWELPARD